MNATVLYLLTSVLILNFTSPEVRTSTERSLRSIPRVQEVPITPFNSIELRDGGKASLRHGPTHRVTFVKGSLDYTQVVVIEGRLIIDKCKNRCPRGYELDVQIVAPMISGISLSHGGWIQSAGPFPGQPTIAVAVSNGGVIDIRSIEVGTVTAAVAEGGAIYTRPQAAMSASIVNGGVITYWGDAQVKSSIQKGGVVTKGRAGDADKPFSDFDPAIPSLPSVPPLPAIKNPWVESVLSEPPA